MDSLSDLLADKGMNEPTESGAIKRYVHDTYQSEVGVQVRDRDIVLSVKSAALASRLRYDTRGIKAAAATDKRIVLRITN